MRNRHLTASQVIALLKEIATRIESDKRVDFRTKDAIRLMVSVVSEALK